MENIESGVAPEAAEAIPQVEPIDLPDGALPMVVWLKGDEPEFAEFTLDAEKVMDMIGIRRSRLTQISGRELRVGRTKIGRYIRPLYRVQDVQEYLAWVKPSASHKKSSEVVEQAAQKLEDATKSISMQVLDATNALPDRIMAELAPIFHRIKFEQGRSENRTRKSLQTLAGGILSQIASVTRPTKLAVEQAATRIDQLIAEQPQIARHQDLELVRTQLEAAISAAVSDTGLELAEQLANLAKQLAAVEENLHAKISELQPTPECPVMRVRSNPHAQPPRLRRPPNPLVQKPAMTSSSRSTPASGKELYMLARIPPTKR